MKNLKNYWRQMNAALENFSEPNTTESSELFLCYFLCTVKGSFWGLGIKVSFTSWSSATLLIFDTSKILTTLSFWGFMFIPQLDSHWAAGGSLWFPPLLATRPGRSGAASGWPLTSGAGFGVFVGLTWLPSLLITANCHLKFYHLWRMYWYIVGSFISL